MYAVRAGGTFVLLIILLILYVILICLNHESVYEIPKRLEKYLMYEELPASQIIEVDKLRLKVKELNEKREVRNWKKFGTVRAHTTVLVVQVHRDVRRLQYLIVALAQVRYIDSVLLIFSHSYYNEHMNRLIRRINFCKVMQIFYPYSLQLHPNKFPGVDPEDCVYGSPGTTIKTCQDRDAKLTEHKQHWWWKANFVFDRMTWSRVYTGIVIFLEEAQYVAPDLLHILRYAQRSLSYFPEVEIISFGKIYAINLDSNLLTLEYWRPPFDVGLAFNKTTWKKILTLSSFYCMYDDYSWSYSLLNLFKHFPKGNINMVACVAPRVISTKQFENLNRSVSELSRIFTKSGLYPDKVKAVFLFGPEGRVQSNVLSPPRGNGGWKDIRDQLLCLDPLITTTEDYDITTSTQCAQQLV